MNPRPEFPLHEPWLYSEGMREFLEVIADASVDGVRLDRALAALLPGHSRSNLARLIDEGRVTVDGAAVTRSSVRLASGQRVVIEVPPPKPSATVSQDLPLEVLYEDADIAVIAKPAGLVVHPSAGHSDNTLVNALLFHVKDLSGVGGELRPGIVHRLDRETSGVMIVAKSDAAHRFLTEVWNTDRVRKEYLALVYGTPDPESGTIDRPVGRDPKDRKRMAVVAGGRKAMTDYRLLERMRGVSLLQCTLRTGRTHQIRVHLKSIGHPIVGDPTYSGPQWRGIPDKRLQKVLASFPRQALHAQRITLPHPTSGAQMTFEAPLPEDLRMLIEQVRG
jgi:23S rRNA pseudouridine1911/1915/1917 synthase